MDNDEGSLIDTRFTPFWHIAIVIISLIGLILIGASPASEEITLMDKTEPSSESLIVLALILVAVWAVPTKASPNGNQT